MSLFRPMLARVSHLPPAETHDLRIERNLRIPMLDGVVLLADHYAPRALGPRPTILTRSVYTDAVPGSQVIFKAIQVCQGTASVSLRTGIQSIVRPTVRLA